MKAGRQSQGLELVSWPGAVQDESWQAKSRLGARKSKV